MIKDLLESFVDSVMVIDKQKRILYINKAASKLFDYSPKVLVEKNVNKIIPGFTDKNFQKLRKKNRLEVKGAGKKGKELFLELTLTQSTRGKSGVKSLYILFVRDISKKKKIEEENERIRVEAVSSSQKLRALFESVDVMLWSVKEDEKSGLYYEQVNDAFASVVGLKPEDYNGKYLKDLGSEEAYKEVKRSLSIAKRQKVYTYEKSIGDGIKRTFVVTVIYAGRSKGVDYFIGSATDITARKKDEQQVQLLAQAFESTMEMINITDLDNRITFVNKAFLQNYGYELNEILGRDVSVLNSLNNPPGLHEQIYMKSLTDNWKGELLNRRKDGSEFPVYLSTSQIKTPNDEVKGLIGVARDITRMKEAEARLILSLKEKEILLKEVYHRVKNNMQVINSLLHIQSQQISDPAVKEMFKESQNRIRIMSLIHEKLYRSEDLTRINFSLYVRDLTDQLKNAYPLVSKNVDVVIHTENIYLGIDKAIPCGLIINELVSNAYKYAFKDTDKGEIYIELTMPEENHYNLIVSDNGTGFPKDIDFRNTDSLGMVLVTTLVDQLEGKIILDGTGGTKFTISI